MPYSEKVLDHYHNPRNSGSFPRDEPGVGTGLVGHPGCGEVIQVQLKIAGERIVDTRFKASGSGGAIASTSFVTELVKGKSLDEAVAIRHTEIARELNLPPVKVHCSVLAEEAVKAAVEDYRRKHAGTAKP